MLGILIVCLTRLCTLLQAAAHIALGQVFAAVLTCQAGLRVEPGCCVFARARYIVHEDQCLDVSSHYFQPTVGADFAFRKRDACADPGSGPGDLKRRVIHRPQLGMNTHPFSGSCGNGSR